MPRTTCAKLLMSFIVLSLILSAPGVGILNEDHQSTARLSAPGDGTLWVNVTDDAERRIQGANVTIFGNTSSWLTDGMGSCLIENVTPGWYFVNASKQGYLNASGMIQITPNNTSALTLTILGGWITGKVESAIGAPIENASVQIYSRPEFTTSTTSTGSFTIKGIPTGNYLVGVSAPGYSPTNAEVTVDAGDITIRDFLLVGEYGSISGTVFEEGETLPDASVSVWIEETRYEIRVSTDSQGDYRIPNVPAGNYTVTASKTGYSEGSVSNVIVKAGNETQFVNFTLSGLPATLHGTVTAIMSAGIVLIYGALVEITGTGLNATTGTQGIYEIDDAPIGTFSIRASAPGYEDNITTVTLERGVNVELNIVLTAKPGQLIGYVRDGNSYETISGCRVTISGPEQRETYTNELGQYVFAGLAPGNYTLTVRGPGATSMYTPYITSGIVISAESDTHHDVYLTPIKIGLGGFIFGMDLAHSFMALAFIITIVILTLAIYLRLKRIQRSSGSSSEAGEEIVDEEIEEVDEDLEDELGEIEDEDHGDE